MGKDLCPRAFEEVMKPLKKAKQEALQNQKKPQPKKPETNQDSNQTKKLAAPVPSTKDKGKDSQSVIELAAARLDLNELKQGKSSLQDLFKEVLRKIDEMVEELTATEKEYRTFAT